jgi:hypothetical protein
MAVAIILFSYHTTSIATLHLSYFGGTILNNTAIVLASAVTGKNP